MIHGPEFLAFQNLERFIHEWFWLVTYVVMIAPRSDQAFETGVSACNLWRGLSKGKHPRSGNNRGPQITVIILMVMVCRPYHFKLESFQLNDILLTQNREIKKAFTFLKRTFQCLIIIRNLCFRECELSDIVNKDEEREKGVNVALRRT